jgi:hypothetical protein
MNDTALAWNLVTAPSTTFSELRERPRFWFPLVLLTVASAALTFWYYNVVDIPWLRDLMISGNERLANMPAEARARMSAAMSRNGMLIGSVVSNLVILPAVYALQAVYYLVAGKVAGISLSFKHWFTMATWSSLPALIAILAGAAYLSTESSPLQVGPTQLQVLSLNELFFHIPMSGRGATLLGSLTLITPWAWALSTICVRTWTHRSWLSSATFALLPSVVVYGCWAVIAFK